MEMVYEEIKMQSGVIGNMNKHFIDMIGVIFSIIFGGCFIILSRVLAKVAIEQQYKIVHIRFNENHFRLFFLILGIVFIILGIMKLTKIII